MFPASVFKTSAPKLSLDPRYPFQYSLLTTGIWLKVKYLLILSMLGVAPARQQVATAQAGLPASSWPSAMTTALSSWSGTRMTNMSTKKASIA